MLLIARLLAEHDAGYEDIASKFAEDFSRLVSVLERQGLWDDQDGWYYDAFDAPSGERLRVRAHSVTGLVPVLASTIASSAAVGKPQVPGKMRDGPSTSSDTGVSRLAIGGQEPILLSILDS
jgi:hypothetical protein